VCDLKPDGCMAAHICPALHGRKASTGQQWAAPCPSCEGHSTSLSLSVGTRGRRILWACHGSAKCSGEAVQKAMVARGIPRSCIPWNPPREKTLPQGSVSPDHSEEIAALIMERRPIDEMRLRLAELIWPDMDGWTVAEKLGIKKSAYYKYRNPK
jgi:hypothetical protein